MQQPKDSAQHDKGPGSSQVLPDEIRKKLGELYHLDEVLKELVALGNNAVEPLGEYLAASPEVIPQARVTAVRALGLIGTKPALEQLKRALFKHELKDIHPVLAESEYVVKNAVIEEFLQQCSDKPFCDFFDAFRRYRLPAAIRAIVKYRILKAIPLLVEGLEDDVLAARAAKALRQLGKEAVPVLLQALLVKHSSDEGIESRISRQRRILIVATLGDIGDKTAKPILTQMMEEPDPNLAGIAIAALIKIDFSHSSLKEARLLLKAAFSHEWTVREQCRNVAAYFGEVGIKAAFELMNLKSLPDLYEVSRDISKFDKSWLVTYIVENAPSLHFIDRLIKNCPTELLWRGLWFVKSANALSNLLYLAQRNEREIRSAVAHVLRHMHNEKAVKALVHLLGDWDRETAKEACESLIRFPKEMVEHVAKSELPFIKSRWKRLLIWVRLRRIRINRNKYHLAD